MWLVINYHETPDFKLFCSFAGVMDKATRDAMLLPRCGVPDVLNMGGVARKRKRRFVTQGKSSL